MEEGEEISDCCRRCGHWLEYTIWVTCGEQDGC